MKSKIKYILITLLLVICASLVSTDKIYAAEKKVFVLRPLYAQAIQVLLKEPLYIRDSDGNMTRVYRIPAAEVECLSTGWVLIKTANPEIFDRQIAMPKENIMCIIPRDNAVRANILDK